MMEARYLADESYRSPEMIQIISEVIKKFVFLEDFYDFN